MSSVKLTPVPPTTNAGDEANKADEEVTIEDQRSINRFARLNAKEDDLDEMLKSLKRDLANVKEATDELLLADDDDDEEVRDLSNIHFRIGEGFIAVSKEEAERMLEAKQKELDAEVRELEARIAPMKEEMSTIKAKLYAKFGANINLDLEDN
ncbi:PREDICTED: prefoldin subunit 4-like [Rhagoletis zephyria]|uniref:prefoldin subunit 4-like n=1 Tax=Rhagoletis zephyria TaxID=28612 RepID=UPI0008118FA7|nr:PREDICTED: prefoldin subunit 4-like [Rhagoletis zephyria]